jgi:hypothetical protein
MVTVPCRLKSPIPSDVNLCVPDTNAVRKNKKINRSLLVVQEFVNMVRYMKKVRLSKF